MPDVTVGVWPAISSARPNSSASRAVASLIRLSPSSMSTTRVGLPKRVVDILEGESLINDATALLALEFGLALLMAGQTPTVTSGMLRLAYRSEERREGKSVRVCG